MGKKEKQKSDWLNHAILPAIAFTAVPTTLPTQLAHKVGSGFVSKELFRSSILGSVFAQPTPPNNTHLSDDDDNTQSSLQDYRRAGQSALSTPRYSSKTSDSEEFENEIVNDMYEQVMKKKFHGTNESPPNKEQIFHRLPSGIYDEVPSLQEKDRIGRRVVVDTNDNASSASLSTDRRKVPIAKGLNGAPSPMGPTKNNKLDAQDSPMIKRKSQLQLSAGAPKLSSTSLSQENTTNEGTLEEMVQLLKENNSDLPLEALRRNEYFDYGGHATSNNESPDPSVLNSQRTPQIPASLDQRDHLKHEIEVLRNTVQRLNIELSEKLSPRKGSQLISDKKVTIPGKGPIPPWLTNTKYITPLLCVYDEKFEQMNKLILKYEREMREFEFKLRDIVRENERLHTKLEEISITGNSGASRSDWQTFTEQACLVLEENQLLVEQVAVAQEKFRRSQNTSAREVAQLSKQCTFLEAEKGEFESELLRVNHKLREMRTKYEELLNKDEDIQLVRSEVVKQQSSAVELKDTKSQELGEALIRLEKLNSERNKMSEQIADTNAERKRLEEEVRGLKRNLRDLHRKNGALTRLVKESEGAQEYLATVVNLAGALEAERDTYAAAAQRKEQEFASVVKKLLAEVKLKTALDPLDSKDIGRSGNIHKMKDKAKLHKLFDKLLKELESHKVKNSEQEKDIQYLQALVRDKETTLEEIRAEKRTLEEQLEVVWKAAVNDVPTGLLNTQLALPS